MGFGAIGPEHAVDWTMLVDVAGQPPAQRAKHIDARLPAALIGLGQAVGLASGEAVADRLGVPVLTREQIGLAEHGWAGETPLWFYILKEAEVLRDGEQLGPVGSRVVSEVLVGIIDADQQSFRSVDRGWQPTLPGRRAGSFGLEDILVPPH